MKKFLFELPKFHGFHVVAKWFLYIFTFNTAYAITLFPFVIYRNRFGKSNISCRNHESIHIAQQLECGLAGLFVYLIISLFFHTWLVTLPVLLLFCWIYILEWIVKYLTPPVGAYFDIGFEREAYSNENRSAYLGLRKPFAWIKYVFKKIL